jgi:hypothetical protein
MRRGTTQQIIFALSESIDMAALYITFQQGGKTVLEKTIDDVVIDGNNIIVDFTQEDTLALKGSQTVYIQLRIRDTSDNAVASNVLRLYADDILKEGVI